MLEMKEDVFKNSWKEVYGGEEDLSKQCREKNPLRKNGSIQQYLLRTCDGSYAEVRAEVGEIEKQ